MKLTRILSFKVHVVILIFLCHINNFGVVNSYRYPVDDQLPLASSDQDLRLAILDPKLYQIVKDPVQKRFQFTLDDAVQSNEINVVETKPLPTKTAKIAKTTAKIAKTAKKDIPPPSEAEPWPAFLGLKVPQVLEKIDVLKEALNIFVTTKNDSTNLQDQIGSQTHRKYHGRPLPHFNRGRFLPYFTLPNYLNHKRRNFRPYPQVPQQGYPYKAQQPYPSQAPAPTLAAASRDFQTDPNADLESFHNFGQDYTKSPDSHEYPPELSTTHAPNFRVVPLHPPAFSPSPAETHSEDSVTFRPIYPTPRPHLSHHKKHRPFPFLKIKPRYRYPIPHRGRRPPVPINSDYEEYDDKENVENFTDNNQLPPSNLLKSSGEQQQQGDAKNNPQDPKDRGVKTRFFTRITDVVSEGGDDPPIRTIVSQGPFIYDDKDLTFNTPVNSFEEEDKIDKEIPIIIDDIDREDAGYEPTINWAQGPYGTFDRRATMRPAYYPPDPPEESNEVPYRR